MRRFVIPGMFLLVFGSVALSFPAARPDDEKKETPASPPADSAKKDSPALPTLPDDTIIAVFDNLAEALSKSPNAIVLTPEKYKSMLDEIARLKRLLGPPRSRRPSSCTLRGKVEGNLVQLTAQFDFTTDKADEIVRLGCGLGQATGVSLDGHTPRLRRSFADKTDTKTSRDEPEGFVVEVARPGEHTLTLDLLLLVTTRLAAQGLTLDLPRAAITTIELDLPDKVRDVRVGGKPLADTLLSLDKKHKLSGGLGPLDRLEITWQPSQPTGTAAVVVADGTLVARLGERELTAEGRLTLRVQSGQVKQWRLLVPRKCELSFSAEDQARISRVDASEHKQASLRTIHLKESSSAPLTVTVSHTQSAPRPSTAKAAGVGPFVVLGAARNSGSLLVCNSVPDWHPEFTPLADLTRRGIREDELQREPTCVAAFRYGPGLPTSEKSGRSASVSWLDVEVESVRGQIKTKSTHTLRLVAENEGYRWHVQTALEVTPRWADVDRLTVAMPANCTFLKEDSFSPAERVQSIDQDPMTRVVTIRLTRGNSGERALTPFVVRLEGVYTPVIDGTTPGSLSLSLPAPVDSTQRNGSITVEAPAGLELLTGNTADPDKPDPAGLELVSRKPQEIRWRYPRRAPSSVPLAWQPYRPAVNLSALADVTLTAGEVRVRHELHYSWPPGPRPRLRVRVPAGLSNLDFLQGAKPGLSEAEPGAARTIPLDTLAAAPSDHKLLVVLEYSYALPTSRRGAATSLPLVMPAGVTRGQTRVRVWCDPGQLPGPTAGWAEQNIEVVQGRARLPVLVLRSDRVDRPLTVSMEHGGGLFAYIDRALVRVEVAGDGVQRYRVSYRLARLGGRSLDFELPAPAPTITFEASVVGTVRKEAPFELLRADSPEQRGRLVRLRLSPEVMRAVKGTAAKPTLLELTYQLRPDRMRSSAMTTPLIAPHLLGEDSQLPTRWSIITPANWVALGPESGPATPRYWGRRGWLLAPRMQARPADLEHWLLDSAPAASPEPASASGAPPLALALWHDADAPVYLTHLPQQVWLLVCSLGLVLIGLLLARVVRNKDGETSAVRVWLVLTLVGIVFVLTGLFVPQLGGQLLYGCQPGLAVLVVLTGVQWLLHERYRRQIIFLPSFSRSSRPGSSLSRPEPRVEPRSHGQPSTVDAPRPIGSSVERIA